jgi:hypothetical protein
MDVDTQTPLSWSDVGAGSDHRVSASRTASGTASGIASGTASGGAVTRSAAANVQKYTGRAVPGSVISEGHVLYTVAQVNRGGGGGGGGGGECDDGSGDDDVAAAAAAAAATPTPTSQPARSPFFHQALKLGISQGINRIRTNEKMVPNDGDFLYEHKESLLLPPTLGTPQGSVVQWKDYCPFVFRHGFAALTYFMLLVLKGFQF